jgi:hypothetical protein
MGKLPVVLFLSKKDREKRKEMCDVCDQKNGVRCSSCGCFLIALQKVKYWGCPEGKF